VGTVQAQIVGHPGHRDPTKLTREMISYRFAAAMPRQLRPMILFSEALMRFRNPVTGSHVFRRTSTTLPPKAASRVSSKPFLTNFPDYEKSDVNVQKGSC
jgi:hypothetical protein